MKSALACLKWHLLKHKGLPALNLLAVLCCNLTVSQMSKQNTGLLQPFIVSSPAIIFVCSFLHHPEVVPAVSLQWEMCSGYRLLRKLSKEDPPAFLCHFYNIYFAHTAGGRMIGTKVASMILESRQLNFYKVRFAAR